MKTIKLLIVCMLATLSLTAQNKLKKETKSFKVNKDVTVNLNTSHTNILVDTWNKDYVEIEAYIESDKLSKEALQAVLNTWDLEINNTKSNVKITTKGSTGSWSSDMSIKILDEESLKAISNLPLEINESLEPLLENLGNLESLKNLPESLKVLRIPESPDGNYNVDFDLERYEKEGEKYLDAWSKKYRKEYGEEYEEEMREWAKSIKQSDFDKFERSMEVWGEQFGKDIEKAFEDGFGEKLEKRMEKWGEEFGKNFEKNVAPALEKWGEEFGKAFEAKMEETFGNSKANGVFDKDNKNYDLIKTIKIKMPKKAKLKLNVRHGELKLASVITNPDITVSHGNLFANTINGSNASINVLYSNATILNINEGALKLNYADKTKIKTAKDLVLNAVSSNIDIETLNGNSIIDGSFGDLYIRNIAHSFSNLNIVLENSDALLKLPTAINYNLYFKGNHSKFNKQRTNNTTIKHNPNGGDTTKTIVINAKYSNIVAE
ncbi:hypothetical protein [Lacinutrix sp. 5H-3-7-4]|uniref:hypothetical protein n=1 Tax=Lacinutrix sp. (strain 5H-3-7-4) TaxID=983544 RepID=UPI00020A384E|nr:hypothetical protein [Lacinutrix sp. 5H-3-7-4]AEG99990.1 secreted protein [Lacinutrix sp. 5H-3-7-4]